jgi:hypothetical protein
MSSGPSAPVADPVLADPAVADPVATGLVLAGPVIAARPLDLGEYPVDVVADQPAEPEARRQRVHERPEADSLDDALDPDRRPDALAHPSSVATRYNGRTRAAPSRPLP